MVLESKRMQLGLGNAAHVFFADFGGGPDQTASMPSKSSLTRYRWSPRVENALATKSPAAGDNAEHWIARG